MSKIAIVSANKELARFFELEMELCGYEFESFRTLTLSDGDCDVIFVDIDTVKIGDIQNSDVRIIKISSNPSIDDTLMWPTSIADIHRALSGEDIKSSGVPAVQLTNTVYLIDSSANTVSFDGRYIKLSKTELAILKLLCEAGGQTVKREKINMLLKNKGTNIADVYICNIRKKLEGNTGRRLIFTERSSGYRTVLTIG